MSVSKPCLVDNWQSIFRKSERLLVWVWDEEHGIMRQLVIKRFCRLIDADRGEESTGVDILRLLPARSRLN